MDDGSAHAAAENVLLELRFPEVIEVILPLVGVEARSSIEPEAIAMELVGSRAGDHSDLASAVASIFGGVIAGEDAEFVQHVGVGAEGSGVGATLAGIV